MEKTGKDSVPVISLDIGLKELSNHIISYNPSADPCLAVTLIIPGIHLSGLIIAPPRYMNL